MIKLKTLYVISWSCGLFFSTFPSMVRCEFKFSLRELGTTSLIDNYIFPLMMVMALFLTDAVYAYALDKSKDKANRYAWLMIAEVCFVLAFVLSLFGNSLLSLVMFIIAWLFMTSMKYITTPVIDNCTVHQQGTRVARNN